MRVRATTTFVDNTPNNLPNGNPSGNGWAIYNISSGTSHDGAPQYTQGIQLDTSTVGYSNINFSFDWYSTTQGIRDLQFQYNLTPSNSATWVNMGASLASQASVGQGLSPVVNTNVGAGTAPGGASYVFIATPNDFFGGSNPSTISVNLSSIAGANNDPNLGIRLVSAFDSTGHIPDDYAGATLNGGYTQIYNNSSGNWRFGNLTFQGVLALTTTSNGPALTWNVAGGGSGAWNTTGTNTVWLNSGSASVAYADGSSVTFGNVLSGTSTISVANGGVVPAGVAINNTVAGTGYAFVGGAIGGTGSLYLPQSNLGFVSLSGSNTYSGGTQVSGGTLVVAGDSSLGAPGNGAGGAVVIDNGSTLLLASSLSSGRLFQINGNGGVLNTQSFSFSTSGSFYTAGPFTKLGSGSMALSGQGIQLSGSTTLAAGNLVLSGSGVASLQGGATLNGNLVVNGPIRVNFDQSAGSSGLYGGSGQIQVSYPGSITPSFTSSTWSVLTNSATGSATASGGTVSAAGTISNNVVLNSSGLPFVKTNVAATLVPTGTNAFVVGIGGTNGGTLTFSGNISGNSDVVLGSNSTIGAGGAGILLLSGSNSYSGTTMIDGNGVVQLGSTAALPLNTDVVFGVTDASTATLNLNGFSQTINTLSAGTASSSTITNSNLASLATLTISGGTTAKLGYNGTITGNLALYKGGTGGLTLSGSSTYTGATTIAAGTLTVSHTSSLGVGPLSLQSGATLISSTGLVSLANSGASIVSGATVLPGGAGTFGTLGFTSLALSGGSVGYDFNTTQSDLITGSGTLNLTGATAHSIVINLNTSGSSTQTFNSYPLFTFGNLVGFSSADFTIGSGSAAGYTYGFAKDGSNPNQIDLTISGSGANNLPTRQTLSWATGSGNWDTVATNWTGSVSGAGATFLNGESVTFGEPTAPNSVVTISSTTAISPTGGTLTGVTPLSMTISNTSNAYTFTGGPIIGTTSLIKSGAGMATLSTSNTYTGGTFITGGTLATGAAGGTALGAASGGVTLDTQGTLMTTTSNFTTASALTVNAGGGTFVASTGTSTVSGAVNILPGGTFNKAGTGALNLTGASVTAGTGSSVVNVSSGTLALIPENLTENGQLNVAQGATLYLLTKTATTAASKTLTLGNDVTTINGNVLITNPLTLNFSGSQSTIYGTGAIQFQNMQSPPAPTHFTTATVQSITVNGNPDVPVNLSINTNIQLGVGQQQFYKTSISQSGASTNGDGFILGNGTTDSFFSIAPGENVNLYLNGVISGSCDVQFGPVGGGGQVNHIYLNKQNTYSGVTMFEGGNTTMSLGTSNALPTTTDLLFGPINGNSYQTTLDLAGNNQTVASISYWANAVSGANSNDWTSLAQTIENTVRQAMLTVSGQVTPSRPFGGILGDEGGGGAGALALVKDGPNTLWLNGYNNSYVGGTTIKNGLLLLSPSQTGGYTTGNGDVTLTGGTLQGIATLQGNLIVGASGGSGTVHPGLSNSLAIGGQPGPLEVNNSATFYAGTNMQFDIASTSSNSLLSINSGLSCVGQRDGQRRRSRAERRQVSVGHVWLPGGRQHKYADPRCDDRECADVGRHQRPVERPWRGNRPDDWP